MSICMELPPAIEQEAVGYAVLEGVSMESLCLQSLANELARRREKTRAATSLMARWRETVRKGHGRLSKPYTFNRADAYERNAFA